MIDNLLGNGDDDESTESDDADGLFDEGGGGDLDDDDLMGADDDLVGDDDSLGGMDDGDGDVSSGEVENRIDELENEVDSLSSDVSTVKNENEQISDTIDDVEDNIRKLLEIYEMVTKGVNPFVDETELGDAFSGASGSAEGSMGLFDEAEAESTDEGIDESVANADAEEFFDEELTEEETADDGVEPLGDDEPSDDGGHDEVGDEDQAEFDDALDDASVDADAGEETPNEDDGTSFEDLKAAYEDGADGDAPADDEDPLDGEFHDEQDDRSDGVRTGRGAGSDKPYLAEIPAGYVADVVVMDWLEFLVDEAGVDGAARTIAYYEAIEWLSERAADRLQTYLLGFGDGVADDPDPRSSLTVSHHNTSLRFISRIADPSMEMVAFDDRLDGARDSGFAGRRADGSRHVERGGAVPSLSPPTEVESDGGRTHPNDRGVRPADAGLASNRYGRERYPDVTPETDADATSEDPDDAVDRNEDRS